MSDFTGKAALITGAGSGIGRATTREFAARGASVIAVDIQAEAGAETVSSIERAGGKGTFVQADVTDEASVKAMAGPAMRVYGRLDYLVNCAGISAPLPRPPLHEIPLEVFERVTAVNVKGTFLCMKHCIPLILGSGGGAVVNLSSTFGERGSAQDPAYVSDRTIMYQAPSARLYHRQSANVYQIEGEVAFASAGGGAEKGDHTARDPAGPKPGDGGMAPARSFKDWYAAGSAGGTEGEMAAVMGGSWDRWYGWYN